MVSVWGGGGLGFRVLARLEFETGFRFRGLKDSTVQRLPETSGPFTAL